MSKTDKIIKKLNPNILCAIESCFKNTYKPGAKLCDDHYGKWVAWYRKKHDKWTQTDDRPVFKEFVKETDEQIRQSNQETNPR